MYMYRSELPRPFPVNQTLDVHRRPTLVTLTSYSVTLTLIQCTITRSIAAKQMVAAPQNAINEVYVFSIKYLVSDIILNKHKRHLFC